MLGRLLPFALAAGLMFFGYVAYQEAKPEYKNRRVYTQLQEFIPYKVEKRIGGLTITSTQNDKKEKPPAAQFYHRLDQLEKQWGKKHLKIEADTLSILDDSNKTIKTITLKDESEKSYIHDFFELK